MSQSLDREYWLAQHVYVCPVPNGVILLDLRRDKYFALSALQVQALARTVNGWPGSLETFAEPASLSERDALGISEMFVEDGLLTREPEIGKTATPVRLTDERTLTAVDYTYDDASIRAGDVRNFLMACASAAWALRAHSIEVTMRRLALRKAAKARSLVFDEKLAGDLVGRFRGLRTYFFTAQDRCLFNSLALVNFLSRYDLFPMLVIGIATQPFMAHSWVQQGPYVLDTTPEEVCFYTPIFAV